MPNQLINIRTDKFTKKEIKVIEDCLKEWNYEGIVDILYLGESDEENLDVTFTLQQADLGEFLWILFGCGHEFAYER
jgi:hypothetical protein